MRAKKLQAPSSSIPSVRTAAVASDFYKPHACLQAADPFCDLILEQLAPLPGLRCKRMFGGHGLYSGEQFFGIVYDGRLYFKMHPDTLQDCLDHHCAVFAPSEKQVLKNYREAPADILEDAEQLAAWARKAGWP
jgi:DNA transformation protein